MWSLLQKNLVTSGAADETFGGCLLPPSTSPPPPTLLPPPAHHGLGGWEHVSIRMAQMVGKCIPRQFYEQSSNLKRSPRSHNCREIRYINALVHMSTLVIQRNICFKKLLLAHFFQKQFGQCFSTVRYATGDISLFHVLFTKFPLFRLETEFCLVKLCYLKFHCGRYVDHWFFIIGNVGFVYLRGCKCFPWIKMDFCNLFSGA